MLRNPILVKLFRLSKLLEKADYDIDKMLTWEKLSRRKADFGRGQVCPTVVYSRIVEDKENDGTLSASLVEMKQCDSPKSPTQKYRFSENGITHVLHSKVKKN